MTKKDIIRHIAAELGLDQTLTKAVAQRFLDVILEVLQREGRIELRNFGVFEVRQRAARKARNPKTNEEVHVPAKRVITFQAGKNVVRQLVQPAAPQEDLPATSD
ncbi:MAG: integration host factor subunit beta [Phycisphaerae bacterium]|nr:integration host factor subunit beta [Phycisphaerae bacterium]